MCGRFYRFDSVRLLLHPGCTRSGKGGSKPAGTQVSTPKGARLQLPRSFLDISERELREIINNENSATSDDFEPARGTCPVAAEDLLELNGITRIG